VAVVVAYLACALIWGTTWFGIRVCIAPGGYPTYLAAALRFALAAGILVVLYAARVARPGPGRREAWWLVLAGLLNAVGYGLVYTAEERIPGGLAAVLYGTAPLLMAIMASLARIERVSVGSVGAAALSLAGVFVIYRSRLAVSAAQAAGVGMILGSVVISNCYAMILKRHANRLHPLATTGSFLLVTALAMGAFAATRGEPMPWPPPVRPTLALLYLGIVGSVIAFASYFYLLKRLELMTLSTLVFLQPLIALGADALWERQAELTTSTYVGVAITLAGVVAGVLVRGRAAAAPPPAAGATEDA